MCFHTAELAAAFAASHPNVYRANLIVRDASDEWVGAWIVDVRDLQDIANVRRDLNSWHRNQFSSYDFTEINQARFDLGLDSIGSLDLPEPQGEAHPGIKDETKEAAEKSESIFAKLMGKVFKPSAGAASYDKSIPLHDPERVAESLVSTWAR